MFTTKIYGFSRSLPKRSAVKENLVNLISKDPHGRIKHLPGGELAVLASELGFMELIYHISLYRPAARLSLRNRMVLVSTQELRSANSAEASRAFEKFTA